MRAGSEPYRVLSLFAGIGGFDLGLERTGGFKTVAFCEIDPFCQKVLAKHWPGVPIYDDVRELTAERLRADGTEPDCIAGGFPCQDISIAGDGAGLAGERSGLFFEIMRLAGELAAIGRPVRYILLENVSALLGRGLGDVLRALAAIGYDAEWHCIPVGRLGAPHERDRVWIIAYPTVGRGRAVVAGRDDADRTDAGRPQADRLLREIPAPSCQWYLAAPDAANDHGQRRRQYHRPEVAVQPEKSGLTGAIGHDGWDTPWPRFLEDICRVDDGLRGGLDKAGFLTLGNTVSPQIPELIGRAILEADSLSPNNRSKAA